MSWVKLKYSGTTAKGVAAGVTLVLTAVLTMDADLTPLAHALQKRKMKGTT